MVAAQKNCERTAERQVASKWQNLGREKQTNINTDVHLLRMWQRIKDEKKKYHTYVCTNIPSVRASGSRRGGLENTATCNSAPRTFELLTEEDVNNYKTFFKAVS